MSYQRVRVQNLIGAGRRPPGPCPRPRAPPGGLDAEVFQERVKAAQAVRAGGDAARAEATLREALGMWRGPALAGLNGSFFAAARHRLEETRAAGLEAGKHARLVPELLRLVGEFPLREGFRYLLMLALYRCGRQAEALAAYRDARDFFADEFGVEPGERLQNLHVSILRSDPSLAAPPAQPPTAPPVQPSAEPPADLPGFAPIDPPAAGVIPPIASIPATAPAITAFAGEHRAWTPPPAGRRLAWPLRVVLLALPVVSIGLVTWALIAYYAARRRSRLLALSTAGYLALSVVFLAGANSGDPEQSSPWDGPIFMALLATMFGGAVHLALLTADPPPARADEGGMPVLNVQLIERRVRREQARSLVAHHPSIARSLAVGRPDLPRTFDDGGLVDVNSAPEHVPAALPGVDSYHAKLIVLARTAHGPLASVDDLATREILPHQAVYALRDMLIAVPPATDRQPAP